MNLKKFFSAQDLTIGTPWKKIIQFTFPMLIGNIVQQLYNTVDSIVVGKYIGDNALAAVGSSGSIFNLLIVLFVGIAVGSGIMVSQFYGNKDREKLSKTIGSCISLIGIISIIIMILGFVITEPILKIVKTPNSIFQWSKNYLLIMFLGISGMAYYNILSAILQALGDSFSSLLFLICSTFINIILDILFVAKFNMGISGVAIATVIAQAISAILCIYKLLNMNNIFNLNIKYLKLDLKHSLKIIKLGLPSGLTQAIFSFAMLSVQSLTNSFGEMLIASNVILMRVDAFAMMPNFSFGSAMTTFTGQNIGANKFDRVEKGTKQGVIMAVSISSIITLFILIFGRYLMSFFTNTNSIIDLSMHMMKILAIGYIAMAITQCLSGVMRGAGDTVTPMWISIIITVFIRVPIAYFLIYITKNNDFPNGRAESIFISHVIAWILGAIITTIFYKKGKWKNKITNILEKN